MEQRAKLAQSLTEARQNLLREKDHEQDDEEKLREFGKALFRCLPTPSIKYADAQQTEQTSTAEENAEHSEHAVRSPSTSSQSSNLSAESVSSEDEEENESSHAHPAQKTYKVSFWCLS